MFYLAGIIITFFLSILLAGKKGKSQADKILTAWLVVIGLHLTTFYLYISGNYLSFPWLLGVEIPLALVHGPFLFLYTTALTRERKIKAVELLHFLPLVFVYSLMMSFFGLPAERKIFVYQNQGIGYEWLTRSVFIAVVASGIIYVVLSFLQLRKHRRNIENRFSNTATINLNWLRYLVYGTSVIWIVVITGMDDTYIFATVVVYVFFIGYFGIRQVGIFSNLSLSDKKTDPLLQKTVENKFSVENLQSSLPGTDQATAKQKYQRSSLTAVNATRIHEQLQQLMIKDKLFKDPELSLAELAEILKIHPNTLSQVINSFENKTFYDYINGLRIEEFKTLVTDPGSRQFTLLSLAFECGFNSKTAFNRNFKKVTGQSPSDYLNQVKIKLA